MSYNYIKIYLQLLLIFSIYSQLSILGPYKLVQQFSDKKIDIAYGKVGLLSDFYIRGELLMESITENHDACSPLTGLNLKKKNDTIYDEDYKILLAYRGSCSFAQKARNTQNAGASMLLVINVGNTPINNVIFTDDSADINIPVALINYSDGKMIHDFIKLNPNSKISVEVNFTPKREKPVVDFKFFFSSSEPRAYDLLGNMTKYLDKFGDQLNFIPHYVVHQNPYYVEENPQSNINCLSRGVYCYFPKETTIIQEGQKILLEDLRQKCMYKLSKEKSINLYYEYMSSFSKECINNPTKSFGKLCSQNVLEKLGYPGNYLDKCIADSFGIGINELSSSSYIDKDNKILKEEYSEILKYKLTSFPAVVINDNILDGIIKEIKIVELLCNNVKIKPLFCYFFTGNTDEHIRSGKTRNKIIYFLIFLLIIINISLFLMCRTYILEKINKFFNSNMDVDSRINNVINNYFSLKNNNDYKAFNPKSQTIEMQEGKVSTV